MQYTRIELFGGLRIIGLRGEPITRFRTRKTALLLAYLALYPGRFHSREELLELFWPDMSPEAGRDNLSGSLSSLRRQFYSDESSSGGTKSALIQANRSSVWLNASTVSVDVVDFERLIDMAEKARGVLERRTDLENAIALYRAPLLSDAYEDWVLSEQVRLAQRYNLALIALAEAQRETRAWNAALSTASRAQQADPYNEKPYQTQIQILAASGRVEAARSAYRDFATFLERELGCRPSASMRSLYEGLGTIAESGVLPDPIPVSESTSPVPGSSRTDIPRSPLPGVFTRLWGRDTEIERLTAMLSRANQNRPRLVTFTGPGGIGKTRLALAAADHIRSSSSDDIRPQLHWLPLADVSDERLFIPAAYQALGLDAGNGSSLDSVIAALNTAGSVSSNTLLLIDNLEHLIGDGSAATQSKVVAWIRLLLERVPHLTILATSRRVLGIAGEQEFPLMPLALPSPGHSTFSKGALAALQSIPSVALFVDRARLVQPDFVLTVNNAASVSAICRRLEGMPLALEMAGAWIRTLSPTQIQSRLEARTQDLQSRSRDLPPRHRSLRATVEWSWELLESDLQQFLPRLSLFRGGWTLEAAEAVADVTDTANMLARLQEHSLIQTRSVSDEEERFYFLEPVREWGLEKLTLNTSEYHTSQDRHIDFFLNLADTVKKDLNSFTARARFRLDEENCIVALNALSQPGVTGRENALKALSLVYALVDAWEPRGLYSTAEQFCSAVLIHYANTLAEASIEDIALRTRFAQTLMDHGVMLRSLGRLAESDDRLSEAQKLYSELGDQVMEASCVGTRGVIAIERSDYAAALAHFSSSLNLGREIGNAHLVSVGLMSIGGLVHEQGNLNAARTYYQEALGMFQASGDLTRCVVILLNQATLALQEGFPAQAQHHIVEGLDIILPLDNLRTVANLLATAAAVAVRQGNPVRAARLYSAADRIIAESGAPLLETESRDRDLAAGSSDWRKVLPPEKYAQAEAEGQAMTLDEAVHYARSA